MLTSSNKVAVEYNTNPALVNSFLNVLVKQRRKFLIELIETSNRDTVDSFNDELSNRIEALYMNNQGKINDGAIDNVYYLLRINTTDNVTELKTMLKRVVLNYMK